VKDPDGHEIEIVQRDQGALWSLDHTMIRVEDADEALGFWTRKFEYDEVGRWEADTFANYFVEPEDAAPRRCPSNSRTTTTAAATRWATPGVTSVSIDDLEEDWDQLMVREAADYRDPESCDNMYAFTTDQDGGHEIELIERDLEADSLFPFWTGFSFWARLLHQ